MQRIETLRFTDQLRSYVSLTKPGILFGNAITAAAGFFLASKGSIDVGLFLVTLLGLSLVVASGCAFNNYIDRNADQKMSRTQNRPLARGRIPLKNATLFATALGFLGIVLLSLQVNLITAFIALVGFVVYVLFYSFLKYRTSHATLIGSIAGATPPLVGYSAVSNHLELGALLLFLLVVLWQMPHFFAIAVYRLDEYAAASIPVLPVKRGVRTTKIQSVGYIAAFTIASLLLTFLNYTGISYAIAAAVLGSAWLWLALQGFKSNKDQLWARKMFLFSLLVITALSAMIPFSLVS